MNKRHTFNLELHPTQLQKIGAAFAECVEVPDGQKLFFTIDMKKGTLRGMIMEREEADVVNAALREVCARTQGDELGQL